MVKTCLTALLTAAFLGCNSGDPEANRATEKLPTDATGQPAAKLLSSRVASFVSPGNGKEMQEVLVNWKNIGPTEIRVVDAVISYSDSSGNLLGSHEYTIFARSDSMSGVAPGESYITPESEGFVLPGFQGFPGYKKSEKVDVTITEVREHSGW